MNKHIPPKVLECTLRDGSYALDFQFTAKDTTNIAGKLDELGFPLIEVGHGIGLGASEKEMGVAAATDEEYMIATVEAVNHNDWGMFCIPGIAELSHLDIAAEYSMDFVRVGTEINDVENGAPFIEKARNAGMYVFSNLMKSYTASREYFKRQVKKCAEYGAQCIYIVDSAGGMLPEEIGVYIDAARDAVPDVQLGFHGHNNLQMGVANSLYCAERGVDVVDTSLQGFGRSAGNTPTEQFLSVLIRSGYEVPFDPVAVMQAGEDLVRPLITELGHSSLDVSAGLALFHSSYMKRVMESARKNRIDPRRLIIALCEKDRVNASPELVQEAVEEVIAAQAGVARLKPKIYYGEEQK